MDTNTKQQKVINAETSINTPSNKSGMATTELCIKTDVCNAKSNKRKRGFWSTLMLSAFMSLALPAFAIDELVTNGDFETDANGSTTITGWNITGTAVIGQPGGGPFVGQNTARGLGNTEGIDQTITTVVGTTYVLSYQVNHGGTVASLPLAPATGAFDIIITGAATLLNQPHRIASSTAPKFLHVFTADSTTTNINFTSNITNADLIIDNVSVQQANIVPGGASSGNGSIQSPYISLAAAYADRARNPNTLKVFNIDGQIFSAQVDADGYILIASADLDEVNQAAGYTQVNSMHLQSDDILSSAIVTAMSPNQLKLDSTSGTAVNRTTTNAAILARFTAYDSLSDVTGDGSTTQWPGTGGSLLGNCLPANGSLSEVIWHACGISANLHWFPNSATNGDGFANNGNDTEMSLWARDTSAITTSSIELWLKADDGAAPAQWDDQSGIANNASQPVASSQPVVISNAINFNDAFDFTPNDNFLLPDNILAAGDDDVSLYAVWKSDQIATSRIVTFGNASASNGGFAMQTFGANFGVQTEVSPFTQAFLQPYAVNEVVLGSVATLDVAANDLQVAKNGSAFLTATANNAVRNLTVTNNVIGFRASGSDEFWNGQIAEIIVYSDNQSASDKQKIESYLAVKYGITLDQTTSTDYLSSNCVDATCAVGTKFRDATTVAAYQNDIAVIARDDASGLNQKQSKSVNADAIVTLGLGSIEFSNVANSNNFASNLAFVSIGDNAGLLTASDNVSSALSAAKAVRITRDWQVQKSSLDAGASLTISFDLTRQQALKGTADISEYSLIIDSDGDNDYSNALALDSSSANTTVNFSGRTIIFTVTGPDLLAFDQNANSGVFTTRFTLAGPKFQTPGGIEPDLALWLKANDGPTNAEVIGTRTITTTTSNPNFTLGQSFTPTQSGKVSQIAVDPNAVHGGVLRLYQSATPGSGTVLATVPYNATAALTFIDLGKEVELIGGTTYSFDMTINSGDSTLWDFHNGGAVADGIVPGGGLFIDGVFFAGDADLVFEVQVVLDGVTAGDDIELWRDQSNSNYNLGVSATGAQPSVVDNKVNFNPAIDFDIGELLTNEFGGVTTAPNSNITIFAATLRDTATQSNVLATFNDEDGAAGSPSGDRLLIHYDRSFTGVNQAIWDVEGLENRIVGTASPQTQLGEATIGTFSNSSTTGRAIDINSNNIASNPGLLTVTALNETTLGGFSKPGISGALDTNVAEFIVYSGDIAGAERQKVESYLALKYGVTLDQTTQTDYFASDCTGATCSTGTIIWDASNNVGFDKDIFGIARDDTSGLDQRVSKSVNTGAILTVALDNDFAAANNALSRSTAHANDLEFFTIANNGGATTLQNNEIPFQYFARPTREWKVESTNFSQTVNLKFDGFNGDWFLIKKSVDSDFSSGITTVGQLNVNGEILNVTLSDGDYFTLAADPLGPTVRILGQFLVTDQPFTVTFEFSEDVFGFTATDANVTNGTLSGFTQVDGNTFTAIITPLTDGLVTVEVPLNVATDINGNPNFSVTEVVSDYSTEDRDNDGVSNVDDLDSDNDGIRDAIEGTGLSDINGACAIPLEPDFSGANRTLESGVDLQVGALYRYASVFPAVPGITPVPLDALVEITAINNATIVEIDNETIGGVVAKHFTPLISVTNNSGGLVVGSADFVITVIPSGAPVGTPAVNLDQVSGTAFDLDSPTDAYESVILLNLPTAVALDAGTQISATRVTVNGTPGVRFDHAAGFVTSGVDPTGAGYFNYANTGQFSFRAELGSGPTFSSQTRLFNIAFDGCYLNDVMTAPTVVVLSGINSDSASTFSDAIPDWLDLDSDGDAIPDNIEAQSTVGYIAPNDDAGPANSGLDTAYPGGLNPIDTNTNTNFDYRDLDSDGDGTSDQAESGLTVSGIVGNNGLVASSEDTDDYTDVNGNFDNSQTDNFPDQDSDVLVVGGDVDYRDTTLTPIDTTATGSTIGAADGAGIADNADTETITVQLKGALGNNLNYAGVNVTFAVTGSATLSSVTATTDANGVATITIRNTIAESVNVTAMVDQDQDGGTTAEVGLNNGSPAVVVFSAGAISVASGATVISSADGLGIADNTDTEILSVQLKDQFGNNISTAGVSVTFAVATGSATFSGGVATATTNASGIASVTIQNTVAETVTVTATVDDDASAGTAQVAVVNGSPASVTFSPGAISNGANGTLISAADGAATADGTDTEVITLQLKDANGNNITTAGVAVTFNVTGAATPTTLTTTTNAAGVATITISDTTAETVDVTATVDDDGVVGTAQVAVANGSPAQVVFSPGAAAQLAFTMQPANTTATQSIADIVVQIQDANGNLVPTATDNVTLSINNNAGTPAGTLSGTVTVAAVAGVATFPGLSIDKVGTAYTLNADSGSLTTATSAGFDITVGAATQFVFITQPTSAAGGAVIPAVVVQVQDAGGNLVTSATNPVSLGIANNPSAGTLSGTTLVNAVGGIATFTGLNIDAAGVGYTLVAEPSTLPTTITSDTSDPFNITVGTATQLAFTAQPTNSTGGVPLANIQVTIQDAGGNTINSTAPVTIAFNNNAGGGTLSGTLTVNAVAGVATFSGVSVDLIGTGYTLDATSVGLTDATSTGFNITLGVASQLAFTTQPVNTAGGATMADVIVTVQDAGGNTITGATNTIDLSINNNPSSGTLSGTVSVAAVAGVATFSTLSIDAAGVGYTLDAATTGLATDTSSAFDITVGTAASLVFSAEPTNTAGGAPIADISVSVVDAGGNVVTGATNSITLAINTNPSAGTLTGSATIAAVNGVATFSGLSIDTAGVGYTLDASATGFTNATSAGFDITTGSATQLVFTTQPVNTAGGATMANVVVQIQDAGGNLVTTATNDVALAINNNAGPGGTLSGTLSIAAVGGVATFSTLAIDTAGTGYTLDATATSLTTATSSAFDITVGAAAGLVFSSEPSNTSGGATLSNVVVHIVDAGGNIVTGSTDNVTLSINNNPSAGTLGGTLTVAAVGGVATFNTLSVDAAGVGYTLDADSGALPTQTSAAFDITVGSGTQLAFTTQPVDTAGGATIANVVVQVQDAGGNLVSGATNSITLTINNNPSSGTLGGTVILNAVAGVATFSTLNIDAVGVAYTLDADATSLSTATSDPFDITLGAAAQIAFVTQPTNTTGGVAIADIVVEIQDAGGNVITGATDNVSLAINNNAGPGGTLSGTFTVAAVNGVATFPGLNIDKDGVGYTLDATSATFTDTSDPFDITIGVPAQLDFNVQPVDSTGGATMASVTVEVQDAGGNLITTATNMVTIAFNNNAGSGTLSGTVTVAAVAGIADFSTLSIDTAGTGYTFDATATSLSTATSSAFDVNVGVATQLAFITQPTNSEGGDPIAAYQVAVQDAGGNTLPTATDNVTISIVNNPSIGSLGAITGTLTVAAVNGVATFSATSIDKIGNGYTLQAAVGGINTTSDPFNITIGPAATMVISTQPVNTAATVAIPAILVEIQDAGGNIVTGATDNISLAINNNPGSPAGTLSGTATVAAVAGIATFPGLSIDKAAPGYTLDASSTALATVTSSAFEITVGTATQLVYITQPSNTPSVTNIAPAVVVQVQDAGGNLVTTDNTTSVALAINANPSAGTLSGTTPVVVVGGQATFSNLQIDNAGVGYTLDATAAGLTTATSNAFDIAVGGATQLDYGVEPTDITGGATIAPAVTVRIEDAGGNLVASTANVTLAFGNNPSGATLSGTLTVAAVGGLATFNDLSVDLIGAAYTLVASSSGLTDDTSTGFNVTLGAASQLVYIAQPTNTNGGIPIADMVVQVQDAGGNLVTSATDIITLAINNNAGPGGSLSGTATVSAVGGVATFSGLNIDVAGVGYTLDASATGFTDLTSTAFDITVGAPSVLVVTTQPTDANATDTISNVLVQIQDAGGNLVTSATDSITLAVTSGSPTGTLGGTLMVSAVGGIATFSTLTLDVAGTYQLDATATGISTATTNNFDINVGGATNLVITSQPTNTASSTAIADIVVEVRDAGGNLVTGSTDPLTLSINNNAGPAGVLSGTATINAIAGVATFPGMSIDVAGTGYTLDADSGALTTATSNVFDITVGVASQLAFTAQPSNSSGGMVIAPAILVTVQDAGGNTVTSATDNINLAINNNPSSGTLGGTTTVAAIAGVATFTDMEIDAAGVGYTLDASAAGLATDTSTAFDITVGTATQMVISTQPVTSNGGVTMTVVVEIQDAGGNIVTGSSDTVTLAIANNPALGVLNGSLSIAAVNGVATFPGLSINQAGVGYTLSADATGFTQVISDPFDITVGAASQLVITTQPVDTVATMTIPNVQVSIQDAVGNIVTTATDAISLAINAPLSAGGSLTGAVSANAVAGVATFSGLSIDLVGAYQLDATGGGLTTATSNAFNITQGAATQLVFVAQPTNSDGGVPIADIVVHVQDAGGNTLTGNSDVVTLSINNNAGPGGILSGTASVAAINGVATFTGLSIDVAGIGYTLDASASGLITATSDLFDINVGVASQLAFTTQPQDTAGGATMADVIVQVQDAGGNLVTTATDSVTLTINNNPSSGTLATTMTVAAIAGVATFNDLNIDKAGVGYTLDADGAGLATATSDPFDITVGAAVGLAFTTQPTNTAGGSPISDVVVSVVDAGGNVISTATDSITLSIAANPGAGTLAGTVTVTAVNGVATFSGLSIDPAAVGYTLDATATGLTTGTSDPFDIVIGAPSQLVVTTQPADTIAGNMLADVIVEIQDAGGNTVISATDSITVAIANNPSTGVLAGTLTANAVAGVATFSGLDIAVPASGYTLDFSATALVTATSDPFAIIDSLLPIPPTINPIDGDDLMISGTGEPGTVITLAPLVCDNAPVIVDAAGNWNCDITTTGTQVAGTVVTAVSTDGSGNVSQPATTTVSGVGDVPAPVINVVRAGDTEITGTSVPGGTIDLSGSTPGLTCTNAPVIADALGNWTCEGVAPLPMIGDVVSATATTADGTSNPSTTTVIDGVIAGPPAPTLNPTDGDPITGTTIPNGIIDIIDPDTGLVICSTVANAAGEFSCGPVAPPLMDGDIIHAVVTDPATGGVSGPGTGVVDQVSPPPPTVNPPGNMDTMITGTGEPGAIIDVSPLVCDNAPVVVDAAGNWNCDITTTGPLPPGTVVTVIQTDGAGNASPPVTTTITGAGDVPAPVIEPVFVGGDISGTAVPGATIDIAGISCSNAPVIADANGNWTCISPSPAPGIGDVISATATTVDGTSTVATTTVIDSANANPPAPDLNPTDGSVITGTTIPNGIVQIIDPATGDVLCTAVADAMGNFTCVPNRVLVDGEVINGIVTDPATGRSSGPGMVTVDSSAPVVLGDDIAMTNDSTPTLTGTSGEADGSIVLVTDASGATVCTATVMAGIWSCDVPNALAEGLFTFTVTQTDATGNVGMDDFTVNVDFDADDDGISDVDEGFNEMPPTDTDGDGTPDYLDTDSDNDGIDDSVEGDGDIDGDGVPDYRDDDSDGDGIPDGDEGAGDTDGDGIPDFQDTDADGDGIDDIDEGSGDSDGDSIPDYLDRDSDNDGILDINETDDDSDGDGIRNFRDLDSDNDGILDVSEGGNMAADADGDGVLDTTTDVDGDGVDDNANTSVVDSDGDGVANFRDLDSDNDSLTDAHESGGPDLDADGRVDGFVDADNNGVDDNVDLSLVDSDGDGVYDHLDIDSDNDGISDAIEAEGDPADDDHDGRLDSFVDLNGDGLDDTIDIAIPDTDGDGIPDYLDLDSDGDGFFDFEESGGDLLLDANGDGVIDDVTDLDGNGRADSVDSLSVHPVPDTDNDGIPDHIDFDSDNDGFPDIEEPGDANGDGVPDRLQSPGGNGLETATGGNGGSSDWVLLLSLLLLITIRIQTTQEMRLLIKRHVSKLFSRATPLALMLVCGSILLGTSSVTAAKDEKTKPWYLGVGYGITHVDPEGQSNGWFTDDDMDSGYKLFVGWRFDPQWALELAHADLGEAGLTNINPLLTGSPGVDYEVPSLMVNYYFNKPNSEFNWYLKGGIAKINSKATSSLIAVDEETSAQFAFGVGAHWNLSNDWFFRTEAESYDRDAWMLSAQIGKYFGGKKRYTPPAPKPKQKLLPVIAPKPKPTQLPDTDGDGIPDKFDDCPNSIANAKVNELGCPVFGGILKGIQFNTNSADIAANSVGILNEVIETLNKFPEVRAQIQAHTDSAGAAAYNQTLSERRAQAVLNYLVSKGISASRLEAFGYGEVRPIADNSTREGRAQNRRVEIQSVK